MKEYTEQEVEACTWWNRLGRRTQADLIAVLELSYTGYYVISAEDMVRAKEFYLSCQ